MPRHETGSSRYGFQTVVRDYNWSLWFYRHVPADAGADLRHLRTSNPDGPPVHHHAHAPRLTNVIGTAMSWYMTRWSLDRARRIESSSATDEPNFIPYNRAGEQRFHQARQVDTANGCCAVRPRHHNSLHPEPNRRPSFLGIASVVWTGNLTRATARTSTPIIARRRSTVSAGGGATSSQIAELRPKRAPTGHGLRLTNQDAFEAFFQTTVRFGLRRWSRSS